MERTDLKNMIPATITFAPALLLPLLQDVVRPRVSHAGLLGFMLSCAPDFVVGLWFPFSILIRPRAWTPRAAANLLGVWSVLTLVVLVLVECYAPFGPNTFDRSDIDAGFAGVALAMLGFHTLVRARLTFGDDQPAARAERLPAE